MLVVTRNNRVMAYKRQPSRVEMALRRLLRSPFICAATRARAPYSNSSSRLLRSSLEMSMNEIHPHSKDEHRGTGAFSTNSNKQYIQLARTLTRMLSTLTPTPYTLFTGPRRVAFPPCAFWRPPWPPSLSGRMMFGYRGGVGLRTDHHVDLGHCYFSLCLAIRILISPLVISRNHTHTHTHSLSQTRSRSLAPSLHIDNNVAILLNVDITESAYCAGGGDVD